MGYNDTAPQEVVDDGYSLKTLQRLYMVVAIVSFILCSSVIVTNSLLIYVIVKFKTLHSRVNNYIKYFAVFDLLLQVCLILYSVVAYFSSISRDSYIYTTLLAIVYTCVLFKFLLAFSLAFDWLTMTFKPQIGLRVKRFYDHFTLVLFALALCNVLIRYIFFEYQFLALCILLTFYILTTLFVVVMDYLNYKHKDLIHGTKPVHSLIIANVIVLVHLPKYIYDPLFFFLFTEHIGSTIHRYTYFIPGWIAMSTSVMVTITLIKVSKDFGTGFRRLFKKSVRHHDDQGNPDGSESDANNLENGPPVLYDNNTTIIQL